MGFDRRAFLGGGLASVAMSGCAATVKPSVPDIGRVQLGAYFYAGAAPSGWHAQAMDHIVLRSLGTPGDSARLRRENPRLSIDQYLLSNQVRVSGSLLSGAQAIQIIDSQGLAEIGLDRKGGGFVSSPRGPSYRTVDLGKLAWRKKATSAITEITRATGSVGVTFDEIPISIGNPWVVGAENALSDDVLISGFRDYLIYLRRSTGVRVSVNTGAFHRSLPDGRLLWDYFNDAIDGAWHEGWVRYYLEPASPHTGKMWESDIQSAERFTAAGRPYLAGVAYSGRDELEYAIACYLLAKMGPTLYFQPMGKYDSQSRGGFDSRIFRELVQADPDLFGIELGTPLSKRRQEGGLWLRDFEHGRVVVNSTAAPLQAVVPIGFRRVRSEASRQDRLNPFSALLLYK